MSEAADYPFERWRTTVEEGWAGTRPLEDAALLSEWLEMREGRNRAAERDRRRRRAAGIRAALTDQRFRPHPLYDVETGLFRFSHLLDAPLAIEPNGWALLAGLTPPEKVPGVFRALDKRLCVPWGRLSTEHPYPWVPDKRHSGRAMPFLTALEIEALFRHGRTRAAMRLLRANWQPMLDRDPQSTFWELILTYAQNMKFKMSHSKAPLNCRTE